MREYEFIFVIDAPSVDVEQLIVDELDGFVGGHHPITLLTVSKVAPDAVTAGRSLIGEITALGGRPTRVYDDLVTRNQIASRAGVTPQAVGAWARNERQHRIPFPLPSVLGGAELWRWAEVNDWLATVEKPHDDISYPSAIDIARLNVLLGDQPYLAGSLLAKGAPLVVIPQVAESDWVHEPTAASTRFTFRAA